MKKSKYPSCYKSIQGDQVLCILSPYTDNLYLCIGAWSAAQDDIGQATLDYTSCIIDKSYIKSDFKTITFSCFLDYAKKCKNWDKIWDTLYDFEIENQGHYYNFCI